jgi:hypothetical protein
MNDDGGGVADLNFFDGLGISISELISSSEEISVETDADRLPDFFVVVVVVVVCVSRI